MIAKEKKIWTLEEDEALKRLYQNEEEKSWSIIAKKMSSQLFFPRKSAKQCRERYENHISSEGVRVQWTYQEEQKMIDLHNEIGNKWSLIAEKIPGKTDNCIKNHFYSKLRKILRKLNCIIHSHFKRNYRQINIGTLYKIVEATQERFKEDPSCSSVVSSECQEVQNKMLHVSMLKEEEFDSLKRIQIYQDLIKEIYKVSKLYKRKSKKIRNSAIQAPNTKRKRNRQHVHLLKKQKQEQKNKQKGYSSDSSSVFEEEEEEEREKVIEREQVLKEEKNDVIVEEKPEQINNMLKDAGILKEEEGDDGRRSAFHYSSRSSFRSYSDNNIDSGNEFFYDSENEKGMSRNYRKFAIFRNSRLDDPSGGSEREFLDQGFN